MFCTKIRRLDAGMENSADFDREYHFALGERSVSNISRLLIQDDRRKQVQKPVLETRRNTR